jgi:hypothetical protein
MSGNGCPPVARCTALCKCPGRIASAEHEAQRGNVYAGVMHFPALYARCVSVVRKRSSLVRNSHFQTSHSKSVLKDASFFSIIREVTMSGLLVGYWSILHNLGTCRIDSSPNQPH